MISRASGAGALRSRSKRNAATAPPRPCKREGPVKFDISILPIVLPGEYRVAAALLLFVTVSSCCECAARKRVFALCHCLHNFICSRFESLEDSGKARDETAEKKPRARAGKGEI